MNVSMLEGTAPIKNSSKTIPDLPKSSHFPANIDLEVDPDS